MSGKDFGLDNLLDLDGTRFVIDETLGLWVKFDVKRVTPSQSRPHGIRYSLTLHDRYNTRILGFDNAHAVEQGGKMNVVPEKGYDHWHRTQHDKGHPYTFINAGKLLEDFWFEVDKAVKKLEGEQS